MIGKTLMGVCFNRAGYARAVVLNSGTMPEVITGKDDVL
jgi:hypothetical protein